jgi:hypothetical protein
VSKKKILLSALGAFLFLIVVSGSFRTFIGSAAGGFFGLARDTFSQKEVLVGEIPLSDYSTSSVLVSAPVPAGNVTSSVAAAAKSVNVAYSSGLDAKALNEKLDSLEDKIANLAAAVDSENSDEPVQAQMQTVQQNSSAPAASVATASAGTGKILVSEIMVGAESGANFEFIELYNAGSVPVDMTGWVIKKKTSSGSESSLVASKLFSGKVIQPGRYLLLGNAGGYAGSVPLDIAWSSSNTLAYKNNSIVVYDADGYKLEEIGWDEIPKGESLVRSNWNAAQFVLSAAPTPQNSRSI